MSRKEKGRKKGVRKKGRAKPILQNSLQLNEYYCLQDCSYDVPKGGLLIRTQF